MVSDELNGRISRLEANVEEHGKKLDKQTEKNDSLTRLVTLFETQEKNISEREKRQEERDRKQQEQMDKFGVAMEEVVISLSNINHSQQQLKSDMGEIGERVADIEKSQEESKIDPMKLFKNILGYIFTSVGSIVLAWILFKFGM